MAAAARNRRSPTPALTASFDAVAWQLLAADLAA